MPDITEQYGRRTAPGEEPLLRTAIANAERTMTAHVRKAMPGASIFSFGAVDLFPGSLAFWVRTPTDAERDALLGDPAVFEALRSLLRDAGYPEESLGRVGFTAQSDETVDRDYGGNWYHATK